MVKQWLHRSYGKISEVTLDIKKGEVVKEFYRHDIKNKRDRQIKARDSFYHSFYRELTCLKRLKGAKHFPQLIDYNKEDMWIKMTYCGTPYPVDKTPRDNKSELIPQAQKILDTLQEKKIKYPYKKFMHMDKAKGLSYPFFTATNLHILDDVLYLIDFETSYPIDSDYDKYFSAEFKQGYRDWSADEFMPLFQKLAIDDESELSSQVYLKSNEKQFMKTHALHIRKKWLNYQNNSVGENITDRIKKFRILNYAGPEKTMIDIGANHGKFGINLQNYFRHIDCVEPFCPAPDPIPSNMSWHPMGFKEFIGTNKQQWDLVLTFATTMQIADIDQMTEAEIAKSHYDLIKPNGYLIYETQKQNGRPANGEHVQKIMQGLTKRMGEPIKSGKFVRNKRGGRSWYVFHKK